MAFSNTKRTAFFSILLGLLNAAAPSMAEDTQKKIIQKDGSYTVPSFVVPFSAFASEEAKAAFIKAQESVLPQFAMPNASIAQIRTAMDEKVFKPWLAEQQARYSALVEDTKMGGVPVQVVTPKAGISAKNAERILINVHGGGFTVGARLDSQIESIPIAVVGGIKVISIDYRMAPEFKFPAASEDVAAVYREVLKKYKPESIAIYGCSAGGMLSAQAIAWFQKEGLPNPAAIGVFCAATSGMGMGDSAYVTPRLGSVLPAPGPKSPRPSLSYFVGVDAKDPLAFPGTSPALLAKFPPTLFITGSRSGEMSAATRSHINLVKAGVDARIFVWDGLDHGFICDPTLPESREAYSIITKFFDEKMDKASTKL